MVETYALLCHPDTPARAVRNVTVDLSQTAKDVRLTFRLEGIASIVFPEPAAPRRTDDLWKTTCFELFVRPAGGTRYLEFNFSPSGHWAAYEFADHRTGMRDLVLGVEPRIAMHDGKPSAWNLACDLGGIPHGPLAVGISAVIAETDGTTSYWALAHAPGAPDFHNPDCFIATLPAPARP